MFIIINIIMWIFFHTMLIVPSTLLSAFLTTSPVLYLGELRLTEVVT